VLVGSNTERCFSRFKLLHLLVSQEQWTGRGAQRFSGSLCREAKDIFEQSCTNYVTVWFSGGCCSTYEITVLLSSRETGRWDGEHFHVAPVVPLRKG